jgi:hypothetical protein
MEDKAKFAVKVLRQYAEENLIPARDTSDLSPMEQWLIIQLFLREKRDSTREGGAE